MSSVEIEARTVDEAVEEALELLRLPRERVRVEILAGESRGIFGLSSPWVRLRVIALDDAEGQVSRETLENVASRARQVVQELLGHLTDSPQIEQAAIEPGLIRFGLGGSNTGILIGRSGRTLDALEHLLNRIVWRDVRGPVPARIELEVGDYRARRSEALADLARRSADEAIRTRRPVFLSPMSSRERRFVHLALKDDVRVTSESEGQGESRRVVVRPTRTV